MALSKIDVGNMLTGLVPNDNTISRPLSKPIIINGNMAVAQRGTSFSAVGDGVYTLDRYESAKNNDGAVTITQEALTSGNAYTDGFRTALKVDVTTADGTLAGTQRFLVQQIVEAQNLQSLKFGTANAEKLTLAFWVKATKTGTHIVRMFQYDDDRSVSIAYTVNTTNTWEKKVMNFPADTTGVIDNNNGHGIQIAWAVGAGADFQSGTLATAWAGNTSANDFVGQVNGLDNTSNNFHLTGIQLEVGEFSSTTLPPFQHESFEDNFLRCLRYYQDDALYSSSGDTAVMEALLTNDGANFRHLWKQFLVPMRAAPSTSDVIFRDDTGSSSAQSTQDDSQLRTVLSADLYGRGNVGSGDSDTNSIYYHGAKFDAEL